MVIDHPRGILYFNKNPYVPHKKPNPPRGFIASNKIEDVYTKRQFGFNVRLVTTRIMRFNCINEDERDSWIEAVRSVSPNRDRDDTNIPLEVVDLDFDGPKRPNYIQENDSPEFIGNYSDGGSYSSDSDDEERVRFGNDADYDQIHVDIEDSDDKNGDLDF